jgi:mono/diheme cytochrome c family protein
MKATTFTLAAGVVMMVVAGCSGRLAFDPYANDDAARLPSPQTAPDARAAEDTTPPRTPDAAPMREPDAWVAPAADAGPVADTAPLPDTAPSAPTCPPGFDVLTEVFNKKCALCHGASAPAKNLDLVTAGLAARLLDKPSTCGTKPLLSGTVSEDAVSGLLMEKLAGAVDGCGVQMPAGAPALSAIEIACVNDWAVAAINSAAGR